MLVYASLALFSTWKFMFTPLAGPVAGLSYWETLFSCMAGAYFSVTIFYFASSYWMRLAQERKAKRIAQGKFPNPRNKAKKAKMYRKVVVFKSKLRQPIVCWLFPLFLSLPLGTIITAKFFRHSRLTFPFIMLGTTVNGFILTGIAYTIHGV